MHWPPHIEQLESQFSHLPRSGRIASWLHESYYHLREDLGVFFRQQKMRVGQLHTDCIPQFWLYIVNHFNGELSYFRLGKEHTLRGSFGVFIPPFSIVNWKFNVNQFYWCAYEGTSPISRLLPQEPVYFSSKNFLFQDDMDIFKHILQNKTHWAPLGAQYQLSAVALKTKNYIDQHFKTDLKMSEVAQNLNYSMDVMTRQFKKMYQITPSIYLRDLKFYQAALKITDSKRALSEIAAEVGVSNYENFSKVFRKIFKTTPKNFRDL